MEVNKQRSGVDRVESRNTDSTRRSNREKRKRGPTSPAQTRSRLLPECRHVPCAGQDPLREAVESGGLLASARVRTRPEPEV